MTIFILIIEKNLPYLFISSEDRRISNVDDVMPNDQPVVKEVVKAPKSGNLSEVSFQRKHTNKNKKPII